MDNYNDNILMEKVPIEMKIQEMTPRERNEYSEGCYSWKLSLPLPPGGG